jgi:hypothetical protein
MTLLLCTVFFGTFGCQNGPRRAAVSGTVLVDKVPLHEGTISFVPTDGTDGPETGGAVKDGKYSIPAGQGAVVGKNKVIIRGFRKTGKQIPDIMDKTKFVDERVKALGPEYNDNTTLLGEIKDGKNELDFDLPAMK